MDLMEALTFLPSKHSTVTPALPRHESRSSLQTAIFYTDAVRTFQLSDSSRGLEFITNIHLIKCKLPRLTLIFLGKEKICKPSPTVDTTSADIMQFISPAKQRSGLLASENTVKPCMTMNSHARRIKDIYVRSLMFILKQVRVGDHSGFKGHAIGS